jgi:hypothetical protein
MYWAAMEARGRAVAALPTTTAHILVDGKRRIAGGRVAQTEVPDGDAHSASIPMEAAPSCGARWARCPKRDKVVCLEFSLSVVHLVHSCQAVGRWKDEADANDHLLGR